MRSPLLQSASTPATILLVDDNADGIMARRSVLQELGYTVLPARCGREALKLAAKETFDLVITDYRMSPVDGLELIQQLRELNYTKPIILLTGFAENLGLKPETTGADAVIQKSANEIVNLVRVTKRLLNFPRKPAASQVASTRKRAQSK
ncbi:MAG TPA: response regulator [Bryobacteraceae bacterium]|jgi:CheY-like chemotaxis protein|nr:response regulator [Bryobacteraceae bacterium]